MIWLVATCHRYSVSRENRKLDFKTFPGRPFIKCFLTFNHVYICNGKETLEKCLNISSIKSHRIYKTSDLNVIHCIIKQWHEQIVIHHTTCNGMTVSNAKCLSIKALGLNYILGQKLSRT